MLTCTCLRRCGSRLLPAASLPAPQLCPVLDTEPRLSPQKSHQQPRAVAWLLAQVPTAPLALSEQVVSHPLSGAQFPPYLTREWHHSSANNNPFVMKKGDF